MFTKMKNIESAFRYIRGFTLIVVSGAFFVAALAICESVRLVRAQRKHIYVLAAGRAIPATEDDRADNIRVEARDQVRTFHRLFFNLDPDEEVIDDHISRALYLADASAKTQYEDLREQGYYANLIAGNITQRIRVDSIHILADRYPYYFRCYAIERIIRTTSTLTRRLVTEGTLRNVSRSDHNPHGFLIQHWKVLDNHNLTLSTH